MAKKIQGEDGKVYVEKKPFYKRWWFIVIAIIVVLGVIGSLGGNKDNASTAESSSTSSSATSDKTPAAKTKTPDKNEAYQKFLSIQAGMTVDQINDLLGSQGVEEASTNGMKTYEWKLGGLKSITITMDDAGGATSKTQIGLGNSKADVSMDKYNQIQEGMTYDQVKGIIGSDGALTSELTLLGSVTQVYTFTGKGSIIVTIQDGAVASKAQSSLK